MVDGRFFGHFFWKVEGSSAHTCESRTAHMHSQVGAAHMWKGHSCVGAAHVWKGHSHVGAAHMWKGYSQVGAAHV